MKKIFFLILLVAVFSGCSESILDTAPITEKTNVDFYKTSADMDIALTAAYMTLSAVPENQVTCSYPIMISDLMSDDCFGGGGLVSVAPKGVCDFKVTGSDMYHSPWLRYYRGIFRCNMLLDNINVPAWESDAAKGRVEGQARFLRALFYFDMARLFGEVPLILETKPQNLPKAPAAELYAQIATDLKSAIEIFPKVAYGPALYADMGRANRWVAEALIVRVFLFYTGYYETTNLPLVGGGTVSKAEVIAWLEECRDQSGYHLMPEFRNLWPYSVSNAAHSGKPYKYAVDNNLDWYTEDGRNYETMFAIKFGMADGSSYYSNVMNVYLGSRGYSFKGVWGEGWGMGSVNTNLWDAWPDNDIRKRGSICKIDDPAEEVNGYGLGVNLHDSQVEETGYWQKKYRPINVWAPGANGVNEWHNYSVDLYGATNSMSTNNYQDIVLIRFADVLLMHSELTQTANGINLVRARVGLAPVAYTLDALKAERRFELAFEGERYYDLLRWATKSNLASIEPILESKNGVTVFNNGLWGVKKGVDFRPITGGFLQIPNKEIQLSEGKLVQNTGWEQGTAPEYSFSY